MNKATYTIEGMSCGGCVRGVTSALQRALPEARVHVSLDDHTASIEGAHDEAQVKEAVEGAGFGFEGRA